MHDKRFVIAGKGRMQSDISNVSASNKTETTNSRSKTALTISETTSKPGKRIISDFKTTYTLR